VPDNCAVSISTTALGDEVGRALAKMRVLLLKNHGSIVTGGTVAEVCVTAYRLGKGAETMLRAATLATLRLMAADRKAALLAARTAPASGSPGTTPTRLPGTTRAVHPNSAQNALIASGLP